MGGMAGTVVVESTSAAAAARKRVAGHRPARSISRLQGGPSGTRLPEAHPLLLELYSRVCERFDRRRAPTIRGTRKKRRRQL